MLFHVQKALTVVDNYCPRHTLQLVHSFASVASAVHYLYCMLSGLEMHDPGPHLLAIL